MELLRTAAIPVAIGGLFLGLSALLGLLEGPVRHRAFFAQSELISLSHGLILTLPTLAKYLFAAVGVLWAGVILLVFGEAGPG